MSDTYGFALAKERGIVPGAVGHKVVLENELIRIWEVRLEPGESIPFHIHHHPYTVISLGGGDNEVETIFGDTFSTFEPLGHTTYIDQPHPIHRLTNRSKVLYLSRLTEFKQITWLLA